MTDENSTGGRRMDCLGCNLIEIQPVTLLDGTSVCTSCELWRAECEVRVVLMMRTLIERRAYLELVEKHRGKSSADALRAAVAEQWEKSKAA